jgi:hypothetical protein
MTLFERLADEDKFHLVISTLDQYKCIVTSNTRTILCTLREDLLPPLASVLKPDLVEIEQNFENIPLWDMQYNAWIVVKTADIISLEIAPNRWTVTIEEDPSTGELILPLPLDLLKLQGWCEGDTINWIDNKDGTWSIQKANDNDS